MVLLKRPRFFVLTVLVAVLLVAAAACGGSGPEELEIPVKLEGDKLTPETITVKQGDMVTLRIDAAESGALHLHGYDIEAEVTEGEVVDFFFVADATGKYRIAFHGAGGHGGIFDSGSLAPGADFTYEVADGLEGSVIPFHSHERPAVAGTITVSSDAPPAGSVKVEIREAEAIPAEIEVRPGTAITWTNTSSVDQRMVNGLHADSVQALADSGDGGAGGERDIGFLEVRPR